MSKIKFNAIDGGVTSAAGFLAGAVHCGIKAGKSDRFDLALIFSEAPAVAAATFTTNKVKAAPVLVSAEHVRSRDVRVIVANSGNANACTGEKGMRDARRMARAAAKTCGVSETQALICSTGRIGVPLPIAKIEKSLRAMRGVLRREGSNDAARAIMTSDTVPKEAAIRLKIGNRFVTIGGIAKGAGMIDPNMATMLCLITTDAAITKVALQKALRRAVSDSFNRITVDGDMSTNDTVLILANGLAGNARIERGPALETFTAGLTHVARELAHMIVLDGEGVTKFVEVSVRGARSPRDARGAAEAVANSILVKCSWFGEDPNWGRILDAVGYSPAAFDPVKVDIFYDGIAAVRKGLAARTPVAALKKVMTQRRFRITIDLHAGPAAHVVYSTDLTPEYVNFNRGE